ncbi:MAG TPA: hypothetical protein VK970_22320, partial [Candidatus Methylacidiphilales bacterium]|nr:hypothetical protein [Candidatus Methylacidiphilales bacterium]
MNEVKLNFTAYKGQVFTRRAGAGLFADLTQLGLSSATAALGGAEIKTLLGIASTGVAGANSSISKNLYQEKTPAIVIEQMDASFDSVYARITRNMEKPVSSYSLERAYDDCLDLLNAGTLQVAFQELGRATSRNRWIAEVDRARATGESTALMSDPGALPESVDAPQPQRVVVVQQVAVRPSESTANGSTRNNGRGANRDNDHGQPDDGRSNPPGLSTEVLRDAKRLREELTRAEASKERMKLICIHMRLSAGNEPTDTERTHTQNVLERLLNRHEVSGDKKSSSQYSADRKELG